MRNIIILTAGVLSLGSLFLSSAAFAVCKPDIETTTVCANLECNSPGQTLLDGDAKSIIACLYSDDGKLSWGKVNQPPHSVEVKVLLKSQVKDGNKACNDPTQPGGFLACNSACYNLCMY